MINQLHLLVVDSAIYCQAKKVKEILPKTPVKKKLQ
jgi:hypothetical protein